MKIKNGFFYKALKDLKCGDKIVFTKGRRYMAWGHTGTGTL